MRRSLLCVLAVLLMVVAGVAGAPQAPAATTLTVMTMNIWHGDLNVVAERIRQSGANVVSLQETNAEDTTYLAKRLGWNHTPTGWTVDVITALPIEASDWAEWDGPNGQVLAAKIAGVWVYSAHLDYTKYGPYNACFDHDSVATILADEQTRKAQATGLAEWTGSSPGIVAGDLNSPSHEDWTEETRDRHCGYAVAWPTTKAFTDKGFTDTYRALNDDGGETWSPVVKENENGLPEPQDRIDFVLARGVTAISSRTFGGGDDWPSDHLSVITEFTVG